MLAAERIGKIAKMVAKNGGIKTSDLSRIFEVSEMTILRDLSFLESRGLLKRVYGGAISAKNNDEEISRYVREKINTAEKNKIAEIAFTLVKPNEQIFIDPSTTCLALARKIKNISEINVITNGLDIVNELADSDNVRLTCIGGDFHKISMSFLGPISEMPVKEIYFDKVFFSPAGCASEQGITEANVYSVAIRKTIIENAKEVILLADNSKFEKVSLYKICDWNQINTVISDKKPAEKYKKIFKDNNINFLN
ncbi:MAG: DeoR/GlpR family DNA-binding transcription regulator [Actinomycetota bacterium]|jgi:DeoR/GlpR family transcriptional regulator of sugar metabolism|nr:DeoR/GlpR family DNA-binding transcription regulator [Actinomycetota bacterium]